MPAGSGDSGAHHPTIQRQVWAYLAPFSSPILPLAGPLSSSSRLSHWERTAPPLERECNLPGDLLCARRALARRPSGAAGCGCPADRVWALVLEDPARPTGGRTPDPGFVAENGDFLDAMAEQGGQVARMLRDSSWSRAEIEAWAACNRSWTAPTYGAACTSATARGRSCSTRLPTLLLVPPDSPMAPRQEAAHNDLVRTVVVPGGGHCLRRGQPARCLRAVTRSSPRLRGYSRPGARRMRLFPR